MQWKALNQYITCYYNRSISMAILLNWQLPEQKKHRPAAATKPPVTPAAAATTTAATTTATAATPATAAGSKDDSVNWFEGCLFSCQVQFCQFNCSLLGARRSTLVFYQNIDNFQDFWSGTLPIIHFVHTTHNT